MRWASVEQRDRVSDGELWIGGAMLPQKVTQMAATLRVLFVAAIIVFFVVPLFLTLTLEALKLFHGVDCSGVEIVAGGTRGTFRYDPDGWCPH